METYIIKILTGFFLGWLFANFEPLQEALKPIKNKISDKYYIVFYLKTAVSCHKCLSFWITLLLTSNIVLAAAAAFLAYVFDKLINRL
jgi:hypothetical protein